MIVKESLVDMQAELYLRSSHAATVIYSFGWRIQIKESFFLNGLFLPVFVSATSNAIQKFSQSGYQGNTLYVCTQLEYKWVLCMKNLIVVQASNLDSRDQCMSEISAFTSLILNTKTYSIIV